MGKVSNGIGQIGIGKNRKTFPSDKKKGGEFQRKIDKGTVIAPCGEYTKNDEFVSHVEKCHHPLCVANHKSFMNIT